MKSHMKMSFFGFHLLETHIQRNWYLLDVRHFILQKRNCNKKSFSAILTDSKSVAFSLLFSIDIGYSILTDTKSVVFSLLLSIDIGCSILTDSKSVAFSLLFSIDTGYSIMQVCFGYRYGILQVKKGFRV